MQGAIPATSGARERLLAAFSASSPVAGSDAASTAVMARVLRKPRGGGGGGHDGGGALYAGHINPDYSITHYTR